MSEALQRLRGEFPEVRLTARRVAAFVEAPACDRRAILDGAGVDTTKLAGLLTGKRDRQSPAAMSRAAQFQSVLKDQEYAKVLAQARQHLGLQLHEAKTHDMADVESNLRPKATKHEVRRMLDRDPAAYNLLINPITPLRVGPRTAWLEQEALAFADAGRLSVVMVKTFDLLDGQADPEKVGQAGREAAAHILSLQELAEELGFPRDRVSTKMLLILPTNLAFRPEGVVVDVAMHVAQLKRKLSHVPDTDALVDALGIQGSLPADKPRTDDRVRQAQAIVDRLPLRFGDGCQQCPMFRICRDEEQAARSTARLGAAVAGACGEVSSVDEALALASGQQEPTTLSEQTLATMLQRAALAYTRATEAA